MMSARGCMHATPQAAAVSDISSAQSPLAADDDGVEIYHQLAEMSPE